jgi:hypothetical protein
MGKSYNCGYRDKKGGYGKGGKKKGGFKRYSDSDNEQYKVKEKYNVNFSKFK